MKSYVRLRLLADYLAAIRNEIAVDEMFLALSKVSASEVGHFPRVPHWIDLATRRPYLTRALSRMAKVVWLVGGSAIFFIWEYLKFSRLQRSIAAPALTKTDGAILGLSTRTFNIVGPVQFPLFPQTWLTLPWVPLHGLPKGAKELPMLSMLDKWDFLGALVDALTVTQRIRRNRRLSSWVLQTYTAFRWFLVRRAVGRLSGALVTTEHYDRWAVLVDRAIRECRRAPVWNGRMIVVQHGTMGALSQEGDCRDSFLNLPTRLRQVDEIHAYNDNEVAAFKAHVFQHGEISRTLDVHFFKSSISLSGSDLSERLRVLFVGHPLCENFHLSVLRKLRVKNNFEAYYKPHPKAPMSAAVVGLEWIIIRESNNFPRVDLLVSYPSTLVIEYEGLGVPASTHPLDASADDLLDFIEKTQKIIENIFNKK